MLKTVTERREPHFVENFDSKLMERARCRPATTDADIVKQELKEKSFNFFYHDFDEGENICFSHSYCVCVQAMHEINFSMREGQFFWWIMCS